MNIDFVIAVWGDWHLDMLDRATLPSLFGPNNLPNILSRHGAQTTILTRRLDVERLSTMESIHRLATMMPVNINAVTNETEVSAVLHHRWWDRCIDDARRNGRKIALIHPDLIWAEGALTEVVDALDRGDVAALMAPNLRVASETIVPEAERRFGRVMAIPPTELVRMALRHLHPLSAMAMIGNERWIFTSERIWAVPRSELVVRTATRPIIAFDPGACTVNAKYFVSDVQNLDRVHVVNGEDKGFFLSLAPLAKDLGLFLFGGAGRPIDVGRLSVNPDCNVPSNRYVPFEISHLSYGYPLPSEARKAARESLAFMARAEAWRKISRLWVALNERNQTAATQILALCMQCIDLPRLVPGDGPLTILIPSEHALAALPRERRDALLARGNEAALGRTITAHILRGAVALGDEMRVGDQSVRIVGRFDIDDLSVAIIDRVLGL